MSTQEKWDSSTDQISECVGKWAGLGDVEQPESKAVLWKTPKDNPNQITVDISGRHQWGDMLMSPSKRKLAVLSFDGRYKPQNFISGAPQVIKGSRHVDFFEIMKLPNPATPGNVGKPQVRPTGESVAINDPTESVSLYPCWTPDEEFILIYNESSPWLWLMEVKS